MAKKYILGNWKMNGTRVQAIALARGLAANENPEQVETVVFPPFTLLDVTRQNLPQTIRLGAQDCSHEADGAFTGDVSAPMLKDAGCAYVLLGHSERRTGHGETDALVRRKAEMALAAGLIPVICVGESQQQRASGDFLTVIGEQLIRSLPDAHGRPFLIAYEPLWAIGSGKTPTPAEIAEVHKTIATALSYATSGTLAPIVYGGSVKPANAGDILSAAGVDGVLVGGASLQAEAFRAILASAH